MNRKTSELKEHKWNSGIFGDETLPEEFLDSIRSAGIRESLVIKNDGTVISGHKRLQAARALNIQQVPVRVETYSSEIEEREAFIDYNRYREKTFSQKMAEAQFIEETERIKAKKRQGARTDLEPDKNIGGRCHTSGKGRSTDAVAKKTGIGSGSTYSRAKEVWGKAQDGDQDAKELVGKIDKGETTINGAYNHLKKETKKEERKAQIEEARANIEAETVDGVFDVVAIDPPWPYGREYDPETSRVANPYPEMSTEAISDIELPLKDDAVVFLWATHAFLPTAFDLLSRWGLKYKATMVWDKEQMGMGATVRMQCEFCLVAFKGKPIFEGKSQRDIIREKRREHSRKPNAFYEMVDQVTVGSKLDYFAREQRKGWTAYGAEKNKF